MTAGQRAILAGFGVRLTPADDLLAAARSDADEVLRACVPLPSRPLDAAFAEHDRAIAERLEEALAEVDPFEGVRRVVRELRGDRGAAWACLAGEGPAVAFEDAPGEARGDEHG